MVKKWKIFSNNRDNESKGSTNRYGQNKEKKGATVDLRRRSGHGQGRGKRVVKRKWSGGVQGGGRGNKKRRGGQYCIEFEVINYL